MPNTIDPNDLDSIDALLDEAELDNLADEQVSPVADEILPDNAESVSEVDLDGLDELELLDELEAEEPPVTADKDGLAEKESPDSPVITEDVAEKVLKNRADAQNKQQDKSQTQTQTETELTVAEMDGIKKLIIIFSSIIISLAVVGIGIGVWAALSSGGGLDDETIEKFENIESGVTESLLKTNSSAETMKLLGKKLDALSFQIEQINADLVEMSGDSLQSKPLVSLSPKPASADTKKAVVQTTPVTGSNALIASVDPKLGLKLGKVSAQMSNAQRRIHEVNKRVKSLQSQYKKLLSSIKNVEKQMLETQVKNKSVAAKTATGNLSQGELDADHKPSHAYQYTSPGGMLDDFNEYYR